MTDTSEATLYQRLGEGAGIAAVVDGLYSRIMADETLAPFFEHTRMIEQKRHMALFLAAAAGGPDGYKGKDLGVAHAGRGISDADFDRVIGHAAAALAEAGVDADAIDQVAGALMPLRAKVTTAAA
ncbi:MULTISPECIES: group 1 truncated hemoglobin [Microbacterium]|uniref:group I truncated hemoglobin n=1 Tax=Microbacterium TaxID=33882 RepID=UPI00285765ED|nr:MULTISPECIES: group 1 truncated hemoglobin [Microbacterium]MDR7184155.1 hemoglobin [Microbacterium trichothecenolyticum]MDT0142595.1 group 1 truncated hemoglobin [Microbacterium sp. PRC9]